MLCDFRIEDWLVQPRLSRLESPSGVERVEHRSMQVLALLAERAGEVVSREDLLTAVWGETFVSEEVLTHAIWDLRRALRDDSRKPRCIQTVPRRGYRLTVAVSWQEPAVCAPAFGKPSRLDGKTPYPGLAPYTEADAEFFFGREAEVEAVWARLRRRELLAIISPSGAGKTSFLRAGLLPALPEGWRAVVCQPAGAPLRGLAQALVPEVAGDHENLRQLLRFEEPGVALSVLATWRRRHAHALLAVDQFEELFTQNSRDVQVRFAELLGQMAGEVGIHVLLAMRDDFLFSCHAHPALAPIFSELTPLGLPEGADLRRALVEPARACGYRFEDEGLVEEMLADVAQERGALPLLAVAAARLWEARDRESSLLTRRAYRQIGGVAGALAQHAEAALAAIGDRRQPMVREIFRNLVTVQGTRAAMDVEELLSIFPGREEAQQVLTAVMDARLVTSFEVPGSGESPGRRWVEIIHESLLSAWPRLVRWQTQDADGARLRDQLRQAARLWESRGQPADLLWTGASLLDLRVWRQRYPVALTTTEEAFARAMAEQAGRRRLRRLTVAAAIAILLAILAAVGMLWGNKDAMRTKKK